MNFSRQVRDSVHGFIQWSKEELDLVETQAFQRLRRIHQLACAQYVYPGATHTRFEHSLGVFHVAGRLGRELKLTEDELKLVRLAGLLHDIGHGPFSHVSEDTLERYCDRAKLCIGEKDKIHERVTADVIRFDAGIARHLSGARRDEVVRLLDQGHGDRVLKDIVSGTLDADKMDYLLRDSLYCGVRYGMYDLDQLIISLTTMPGDRGREMVVDEDGTHAVEQFVLAKYYIYSQVYAHKVRLVTDAMINRALRLGIDEDEVEELRQVYAYDGSERYIAEYLQWDDEKLLRDFTNKEKYDGTKVCELLTRLRQRRLYKQAYHMQVANVPDAATRDALDGVEPDDKRLAALEEAVVAALAKKPHEVIISVYEIKNVKRAAHSERSVLVKSEAGPRPLEEESVLFKSINEKMAEKYLDCYVAADYLDEHDKSELRKKVRGVVDAELPRVFCEQEEGVK
ncbi:MAG TPA: HD domain-containing protein [bacterium]|nr:HD domain-containing protein [bacterium]